MNGQQPNEHFAIVEQKFDDNDASLEAKTLGLVLEPEADYKDQHEAYNSKNVIFDLARMGNTEQNLQPGQNMKMGDAMEDDY